MKEDKVVKQEIAQDLLHYQEFEKQLNKINKMFEFTVKSTKIKTSYQIKLQTDILVEIIREYNLPVRLVSQDYAHSFKKVINPIWPKEYALKMAKYGLELTYDEVTIF